MTDEVVEIDYTEQAPVTIDAFDDSDPTEVEQEIVEPEVEKGEEEVEPPTTEEEPKEAEEEGASVPLTALKDERQKRQALEEELDTLRKETARYTQKSGDVPDPEHDPIGYKEFMQDEAKVKVMNDRIIQSAQFMTEVKPDYAEKETMFLSMANKDPALFDRMNASKNPALFAYKTGEIELDKAEAVRVTAEEERKTSERADFMKEFNIKPEPSESDKRKESALSMPNLTDATARGDNSTPTISSKYDSDELFNDSPFS